MDQHEGRSNIEEYRRERARAEGISPVRAVRLLDDILDEMLARTPEERGDKLRWCCRLLFEHPSDGHYTKFGGPKAPNWDDIQEEFRTRANQYLESPRESVQEEWRRIADLAAGILDGIFAVVLTCQGQEREKEIDEVSCKVYGPGTYVELH